MTDDTPSQISALAQLFRERFRERLGHVVHVEDVSDGYQLSIPAANPVVGKLCVRDDGDELTISVGTHHWHVPLYMFEDWPESERISHAADRAISDVRDVLEERTILRVARRNGQIVSTESYSAGHPGVRPPTVDDTEYTWRGPRATSDRLRSNER